MEETDFPQLDNNVLRIIRSIRYKSICPHGKAKKYKCADCRVDGICQHKKNKFTCQECNLIRKRSVKLTRTISKKHTKSSKKINMDDVVETPICIHNIYRARCSECKLPNDKNCILPNFNKKNYKDEKCNCEDCSLSEKITKGLVCFVCKKNETFRISRCRECFNIFTKKTISKNSETEPTSYDLPNPQLLPIQDTTKIIRDGDFSTLKSKYIKESVERLDNLIEQIDTKAPQWKIEKYLSYFLKSLTKCAVKRENIVQLTIAEYHLEKIEKIINFSKDETVINLVLEIIWYLIVNNPTVMTKIIRNTSILQKIEKIKDFTITNCAIGFIEKIKLHFHVYKIS